MNKTAEELAATAYIKTIKHYGIGLQVTLDYFVPQSNMLTSRLTASRTSTQCRGVGGPTPMALTSFVD
jgi:hypothetical protein